MESRASTTLISIENRDYACPQCGETSTVTTSPCLHTFRYGSGESAVDLTVELPSRRCSACEFEFLDDEAERLEHEAICAHLGVLSPKEIRGIREAYDLSRNEFAQVTGLGEATLNRWENGIKIQTLANDRYLRLLALPLNMQRLKRFGSSAQTSSSSVNPNGGKFQALSEPDIVLHQQEQGSFSLRPLRDAA